MKQSVRIILSLCIAATCLCSCRFLHREHEDSAVATLGSHTLYRSELEAVTQNAQSEEDSTTIADNYIRQWAEDCLFYDKAQKSATPEMEKMVDDYRRELYLHQYEQQLVAGKMDKELDDDSVRAFYNDNQSRFLLKENILKGVFLIIPDNAPEQSKLVRWLAKPMDNIEHIEKYAYQYAIGYQLFTDNWCTDNQILVHMPFERNELNGRLAAGNLIQISDSTNTYLLQVTEKHLAGEVMPFSYAEPEIRRLMLSRRQADFLNHRKEELYRRATETRRLHIYRN